MSIVCQVLKLSKYITMYYNINMKLQLQKLHTLFPRFCNLFFTDHFFDFDLIAGNCKHFKKYPDIYE